MFISSPTQPLMGPRQLRNSRRYGAERTSVLSSLPKPCPSRSHAVHNGTRSTTSAHQQRADQLSPRVLWRVPTPRQVPLSSLLPALPTLHSARAATPISTGLHTNAVPPMNARDRTSLTVADTAPVDRSDGYGEGYVRLVFDTQRCASVPVGAAPPLPPQSPSTPFPHYHPQQQRESPLKASRLPALSSPTTHTITDAQATAALTQLPDHLPPRAASSNLAASQGVTPLPYSSLEGVSPASADVPRPEAWWSTLDGTLSAYSSLQGTVRQHSSRCGADVSFHGSSLQPPNPSAQNLNDTLGRADRAAIVLSMSYPDDGAVCGRVVESHATGAVALPSERTGDGDGEATATDSVVAAAVAALAARISRAAGSNTSYNGSTGAPGEVTMSTLAHQNTLQELRDTLRMTGANLAEFNPNPQEQTPQRQPEEEGTTSPAGGWETGSHSDDELPSFGSYQQFSSTVREGNAAPLVSIANISPPQSKDETAAVKASGRGGGVGTKRTRDALARLYATPAPATQGSPAMRGGGGGGPGPPSASTGLPRTLSFLSRPGPSFAAPAPTVSTDSAMRAVPWECEPLSLATLERRFGSLEAAHAGHRRASRHTHAPTPQKLGKHADRGAPAGARSRVHSRKDEAPSSLPSPTFSVSTAIFSTVSLSSSFFFQELGDGEALRQSCMTAMSGATAHCPADGKPKAPRRQHRRQQQQQQQAGRRSAAAEAAATQYRREQQRLYASHLTLTSQALAGAGGGSSDVIDPHLEVDYLFAHITPEPRDYKGGDNPARTYGESSSAPKSVAVDLAKESSARDAYCEGTLPSHPSAPRDALKDALQARQALLRRHMQASPAWERLLYKVRQWCDRTQVMVQLDNGACVEQTGARPPQPASHHTPCPQQGTSYTLHAFEGTKTTGVGPRLPTTDTSPNGKPGLDSTIATDKLGSMQSSLQPSQHCIYVDDPAVAHERLMQQVARDEEDVQRQNALQRYRQRQQQWEAKLNESTLTAPTMPQLRVDGGNNASSTAALMEKLCLNSRWSVGAASMWAKSSVLGDVGGFSCFAKAMGSNVEVMAYPAMFFKRVSQEGSTFCPAPSASLLPEDEGGEERARNTAATPTSVVRGGHGTEGALSKPPLAFGKAEKPVLPLAVRGPTSVHAVLCSKLQTWGAPLESDVADAANALAPLPASRPEENTGMLVPWEDGPAARASRDADNQRGRLAAIAFVDQQDDRTPPRPSAPSGGDTCVSSPTLLPRTASTRLSSAEKDLFAFVLTCGSSSRTSSSAADGGLLSLLFASGHPLVAMYGAGGEESSVVASQQALAAVQTILCDGFGVVPHADGKDAVSSNEKGSPPLLLFSNGDVPDSRPSPSLAWEALITMVLEGSDFFDFCFLKELQGRLWAYEAWLQRQEESEKTDVAADGSTGQLRHVTILPTASAPSATEPLPIWPLTVFMANVDVSPAATAATTRGSVFSNANYLSDARETTQATSFVTVDAADLFCALATTPTLLLWLLDAHRSSPTSGWMDILDSLPPKQQHEWHAIVVECLAKAARAPASREEPPRPSSSLQAPLTPSQQRGGAAATTVSAFACEVSVAVSSLLWRQRTLCHLLQRALANIPATTIAASNGCLSSAASPQRWGVPAPPQDLFPTVGSTPYLPSEEGRVNYPVDMRNGYLFSSLAREDIENHVAPQLRGTRRQFAEALRAARSVVADVGAATNTDAPPSLAPTASASLSRAMQQRVHLDRLAWCEHRFLSLLSSMWCQEEIIRAFNQHVGSFNAFTRAEQRRWGPLYRSSLTVAYCVCEELAESGMENLSPDLLPFVPVVAAFAGCRGGHRELRTKLRAVMLDLVERAKRVKVHLDSLSWQGKRAQVLSEAVAAAQIAPRHAGAVVSCLTTESDVINVPLTEVALPAMQLKDALPLLLPEE
jgi:hypothetical protein